MTAHRNLRPDSESRYLCTCGCSGEEPFSEHALLAAEQERLVGKIYARRDQDARPGRHAPPGTDSAGRG